VTRFDSRRRRARLAALVVFGSLCLVLTSLAGGTGIGSASAGSSRAAPTAESSPSTAAVAAGGLSATNSPRPRLLAAGLTTVAVGLAAILVRTGSGPAAGARRRRRVGLVLDDVGDRWRALLIGAPPSSSSF